MNLIQIARMAIEFHLKDQDFYPDIKTKEKYEINKASFVTLTKNGNLRGSTGSTVVNQALWQDVKENAIKAAFDETRFKKLKEDELDKIKIEVFVLSEPKKMEVKHSKFLIEKITKDMGLMLKYGKHSSILLPQDWKETHDKTKFLERLALKAKLNKNDWKEAEIYSFVVEKEAE